MQKPENFGYVKLGPGRVESLIAPYDGGWKRLAGEDPPAEWTKPDFDDSQWKTGAPGFGYGDIDNSTQLLDMKDKYSRVYARRNFEVKDTNTIADLALMINYDDAFIAYLNGKEILRAGVKDGGGPTARGITVHESSGPEYPPDQTIDRATPLEGVPLHTEYFSLKDQLGVLRNGINVLAVEGHNATKASKAFTLDPGLICIYRVAGGN